MSLEQRSGWKGPFISSLGRGWVDDRWDGDYYLQVRDPASIPCLIQQLRLLARPEGRGEASRRQMPKAGLAAARALWGACRSVTEGRRQFRGPRGQFGPNIRRCSVLWCEREATHAVGADTGWLFYLCQVHAEATLRAPPIPAVLP